MLQSRLGPWLTVTRVASSLIACFVAAWTHAAAGQTPREPLPLDVAVSLRSHNGRSPIALSPDGEWIAHTVATPETVPRDAGGMYAATGFPFGEGDSRKEAMLTHTKTGEVVLLGDPRSSSWGVSWSPDGSRAAFYSDGGGEAGVWIWERSTRTAARFPGVIVRPFFGFEIPRWTSSGHGLLVKALPPGVTVAHANARAPGLLRDTDTFPPAKPGQASVRVRRAGPADAAHAVSQDTSADAAVVGDVDWTEVDLVLLDLQTRSVTRLVEHAPVRQYAVSPDGTHVAYTLLTGWERDTQQPAFDLAVVDVRSRVSRTLAVDIRLGYGIEWSWSPDGGTIGYIASGQLAKGQIVLVPVAGGAAKTLGSDGTPSFAPGEGQASPLWDATGASLYAVGNGTLWRVDAKSGRSAAVGAVPGKQIRAIVNPFGHPALWSSRDGRVWVVAGGRDGTSGLYAIDLVTGESSAGIEEAKSYSGLFNLSASSASGEIAFVSRDQQHLADVWIFNIGNRAIRRATRLNPDLDRFELGEARVIEWRGGDGQALRGALLLPPGYQAGLRLPLVVYVYGGDMGSSYVNRFGFMGELASLNMHVLATRGFAVLFPDAPVRTGHTMADVFASVMPGVDAAIAQGYADPDRLAVMGQSYGSFNVLSIIAQTKRFKAAVLTAAVVHPDLFADYLRDVGYYEQGQGDMGGTIWEHHDRYFANSPIFHFDKIETPVLIGQGEKDGDLVPANAIFTALERLDKRVEFRLYQGEGHVITQAPNVVDFWQRRLEFLSEYLGLGYDAAGRVVLKGAI